VFVLRLSTLFLFSVKKNGEGKEGDDGILSWMGGESGGF